MFLEPFQADTQVIESYVRHYPDHWFWLHRRWKQR
jgi:lauroyl/myristoyl acyltransferase